MSPTLLATLAGIFLGLAVIALAVVLIARRSKKALTGRLTALVVSSVAFLALSLMARSVDQDSYQRCEDRKVNIAKGNTFYAGMAHIEASNPYVDATIRRERVDLYRSVLLSAPDCGSKP